MDIALALISGAAIGAVLGVVGAGGAMLSVPILLYIFDFTAIPATTGALAIVLAAAIAGSIPKIRAKEILYREAIVIWALGLVTNLAASILAHKLSDQIITTGFSATLFIAALSNAFCNGNSSSGFSCIRFSAFTTLPHLSISETIN